MNRSLFHVALSVIALLFRSANTDAQTSPDHRALEARYRAFAKEHTVDPLVVRFIEGEPHLMRRVAGFNNDDSAFDLARLLSERNHACAPFYVYVLNQLVRDTWGDAFFAEMTGDFQIRILVNNPVPVLRELMADERKNPKHPAWKGYAKDIGEAIGFDENSFDDSDLYERDRPHPNTYDELAGYLRASCSTKTEHAFCDRFLQTIWHSWMMATARNAPVFAAFEVPADDLESSLSPKVFPLDPCQTDMPKYGLKANFAGHYIVAHYASCGTCCESFAIVDARSGQVYHAPAFTLSDGCGTVTAETVRGPRAEFRRNSDLIIFRGSRDEKGFGTYYYTWDHEGKWADDHLTLLQEIEGFIAPYADK